MLGSDDVYKQIQRVQRDTWHYPSRFSVPGAGEEVAGLVGLLEGKAVDRYALAAKIDGLPPKRRLKLFKAFVPQLGTELARWWEYAATGPFQYGHERRPFRTTDRTATLARRIELLRAMLRLGLMYPQDIIWMTRYSSYVEPYGPVLGDLVASEVAAGNRAVRDVLLAAVRGTDDVARMSPHVVSGLLRSHDSGDWEVVEQLLLAAQRQEGLRQTILEAVDFAHPQAFRRMLGIIVDHKLTRFAATVRAASVWFGEALDVRQDKQLLGHLQRLVEMFDEPLTLDAIARLDDPAEVYLALWRVAHADAAVAESHARALLAADDRGVRLAAARLLSAIGLTSRFAALTPAFLDHDEAVVAVAAHAFPLNTYGHVLADDAQWLTEDQVDAMLQAMDRLGRATKVQAGLLGPLELPLSASLVADRLVVFAPPELHHRLAPAYAKAGATGRRVLVARLAEDPVANRRALFGYLGDAASEPRTIATKALLASPELLTEQEAVQVEALLTRKAADLRRSGLELLRKQPPEGVAASAARLAAGTAEQAGAARELRPDEEASGQVLLAPPELVVDHARRTPVTAPQARPVPRGQQERCTTLATSLVAWLDEHKDVEVRVGADVRLLADVTWLHDSGTGESLPLAEIIEPWWERVRKGLTEGGVECQLVATYAEVLQDSQWRKHPGWLTKAAAAVVGAGCAPAGTHRLALQVLSVIAHRELRPSWAPVLLDAQELLLAAMPTDYFSPRAVVERDREERRTGYRSYGTGPEDPRVWAGVGAGPVKRLLDAGLLEGEDLRRAFTLARYLDEPAGRHVPAVDPMMGSPAMAKALGLPQDHPATQVPAQASRMAPDARLMAAAYQAEVATDADMLDWLVGIRRPGGYGHYWNRSGTMRSFTGRVLEPWVRDATKALAMAERVRDVALDFERGRGEFDTLVSHVVADVRTAYGARTFVDYLQALGKGSLVRGYVWSSASGRSSALCQVLRKTLPAPDDGLDEFAERVRRARIPERRLVEVGVYTPQWASYVEHVLDWPGYEDAVWWLHAHTKGDDWTVDQDVREEWAAQVSQRTPLDAGDLVNGAVDVQWFGDVLAVLGEERFDTLLKAAKFASTSGGHKRAELFAAALRGRVGEADLLARINDKRHQDSVRALGLLPLPDGDDRDDLLLRRYELLRGFVASDRTSGSQRRASESTAVLVGMENLARTAGYRDPQRLVWSMESHAVRDLAAGPVIATDGDLTVSLSLDGSGAPELSVRRGGKPLASVPAKSARVPEIADLKARVTTLRKQASRMRQSLEQACVSGEVFTPEEYAELLGHPMIAPMLRDLVLVTQDGQIGFGTEDPGLLLDEAGDEVALSGPLRIAHPLDLLQSRRWPELQHVLFSERRRQPFRQAFRELYVPTGAEADGQTDSRRYAGHQVQQHQAAALFRSRGWVSDFEVGFGRTFHQEKLTAWCSVLMTWGTPGEVEDATIESVTFHPARTWQPLRLTDVPPRIFSEVMRDLDLVVSVAHAGGVDPETSESSVEVRRRLVEETCDLLGLTNVETTDHHALVKGSLATYSVNLGSGVVHRQPGNAVCIIPVGAQHRGRIFLPFVDDDPRTAEVVSKVVMLARDDKIQDPTILAQLT